MTSNLKRGKDSKGRAEDEATFMLRVRGESRRDAGIFDGDVVLVDRAIAPRSVQVVIAVVDGEFV